MEISYNGRGLFISLFHVLESSKSKVLEIENNQKSDEILSAFNHDYRELANNIRIVKE